MESFNHSLKVEAIHDERFRTREQTKQPVFEYIEVYRLMMPSCEVCATGELNGLGECSRGTRNGFNCALINTAQAA